LLFPYFWSGIALLKKTMEMGTKGIHNWLIVSISSIFIISAFVSATLGELWLVIALVMTVLAVYAIRLTPNKKS